jgi:hypothetical protein
MREINPNSMGLGSRDSLNLMSAGHLLGRAVQNPKGEDLGEITKVVLDAYGDQVSYVVLSFDGGFLGLEKKCFAVPRDMLAFDSESGAVVLTIGKDHLKHTPDLDGTSLPNSVNGLTWWRVLQSHH